MTQKIDKSIFIDAASNLLLQYSARSITNNEIIQESGVSRRCFYDNVDIDQLWKDVIKQIDTRVLKKIQLRESLCARRFSRKITSLIEGELNERQGKRIPKSQD